MTYKDSIKLAMNLLAADPATLFVGYNVGRGSKANGTLTGVSPGQLIETPVAENLMAGMAIGLSLEGFKPVVYFERFDFITNALDAIVNHLDKLETLSDGQFKPKVLIRVVVGNTKTPLFTGPTHTQDFTDAMRKLVSFPVVQLIPGRSMSPVQAYQCALRSPWSTMLVEYKDHYQTELQDQA